MTAHLAYIVEFKGPLLTEHYDANNRADDEEINYNKTSLSEKHDTMTNNDNQKQINENAVTRLRVVDAKAKTQRNL